MVVSDERQTPLPEEKRIITPEPHLRLRSAKPCEKVIYGGSRTAASGGQRASKSELGRGDSKFAGKRSRPGVSTKDRDGPPTDPEFSRQVSYR